MPGKKDKILSGFKLKQDHTFNLGDLYKMMYRWFESHDYEFSEKEYRHYGQGDHIELIWHAEKEIGGYAKIEVDINVLIIGMQKIEIDVDGAKSKANKGSIEMIFDVTLVRDSKDKFNELFRDIYEKFIIKPRINLFQKQTADEAKELINEIKSYLQLHKLS